MFSYKSSSFFDVAFDFSETGYEETRIKLKSMCNDNKLNKIDCGNFYTLSFINPNPSFTQRGCVTFKNIVGDARALHLDPTNANATHQVASQTNCLEMVDPGKVPENGISIYEYDRTQGPICAMVAPAGLAFRNYLHQGGQTTTQQVDTFQEFHQFLKDKMNTQTPLWSTRNGYMMFSNKNQLIKINTLLATSDNFRREARSKIQVGIQENVGIVDSHSNSKQKHLANQVYCSGLPISYNDLPSNMWDGLGELVLEAVYENTLLSAVVNNFRNKKNMPVYLTMIGGGVFGMKHIQIKRAIVRACNIVAMKGYTLDVRLVHFGNFVPEYMNMSTRYPFQIQDAKSVWDNKDWVAMYTI